MALLIAASLACSYYKLYCILRFQGGGAGTAFAFLEESSETDLEPTNPFHQFLVAEAAVAATSAVTASAAGKALAVSTADKIRGASSSSNVSGAGTSANPGGGEGAPRARSGSAPSLPAPTAAASREQSSPVAIGRGPEALASNIVKLSAVELDHETPDDTNPFHTFLDAAVAEVVAESSRLDGVESKEGEDEVEAAVVPTELVLGPEPDLLSDGHRVDENNHYDMLTPDDAMNRHSRASTISPETTGSPQIAVSDDGGDGDGDGGGSAGGAGNYGLLSDADDVGGLGSSSNSAGAGNGDEKRPSRPKRPSIRTMNSLTGYQAGRCSQTLCSYPCVGYALDKRWFRALCSFKSMHAVLTRVSPTHDAVQYMQCDMQGSISRKIYCLKAFSF